MENSPGSPPRIIVVTACLNAAATIADTLESVASQQQHLRGYVIVDGGSTDGTLDVIASYGPHFESALIVSSQPDGGIYNGMNRGLATALELAADDDLVGIINADDYYLPGAFETVRTTAALNADAAIFYGDSVELDGEGQPTGAIRTSATPLAIHHFSSTMPLEHPTTFIRASAYRSHGLFSEQYRLSGDYDLLYRMAAAGERAVHTAAHIAAFRTGGATYRDRQRSLRESVHVRIDHGANPAGEWIRYALAESWYQSYNFVRRTLAPALRSIPGATAVKSWLHARTVGRNGRA